MVLGLNFRIAHVWYVVESHRLETFNIAPDGILLPQYETRVTPELAGSENPLHRFFPMTICKTRLL